MLPEDDQPVSEDLVEVTGGFGEGESGFAVSVAVVVGVSVVAVAVVSWLVVPKVTAVAVTRAMRVRFMKTYLILRVFSGHY